MLIFYFIRLIFISFFGVQPGCFPCLFWHSSSYCHYLYIVWAVVLLRLYECHFLDISERHNLMEERFFFWFMQAFISLFHNAPRVLVIGLCCRYIIQCLIFPISAVLCMLTCCLSVTFSSCFGDNSFLMCSIDVPTCGYRDKYSECGWELCTFGKASVVLSPLPTSSDFVPLNWPP